MMAPYFLFSDIATPFAMINMARINPFRAFRPAPDKVHLVASRSYVTYNDDQLKDKLTNNPYTFIHVINPDYDEPIPTQDGSSLRFEKVKEKFNSFVEEGIFIQDETPSLYIYRQIKEGLDSIGVIAGVHADDYRSGHIKIHEQTLEAREKIFCEYLDITNFNAEPILLCHEDIPSLNAFYQEVMKRETTYDFSTTDQLEHQLWQLTDQQEIAFIQDLFRNIPSMYIADGHHRSASSVLLSEKRRQQTSTAEELASDYFMALMIPASGLVIHGYHRLVSDLGNMLPNEFISAIGQRVSIQKLDHKDVLPKVGTIDLYINTEWYRIDFSQEVHLELPDAAWLTKEILKPILQVEDVRNDPRISFEPETTGLEYIVNKVDQGKAACAFILHPVPFDQLKTISDLGNSMPPKSTWIEPKLRSGLTIFELG